ncbi:hypothetical protein YC2023_013351 [Brassica napus]
MASIFYWSFYESLKRLVGQIKNNNSEITHHHHMPWKLSFRLSVFKEKKSYRLSLKYGIYYDEDEIVRICRVK